MIKNENEKEIKMEKGTKIMSLQDIKKVGNKKNERVKKKKFSEKSR